MRYTVQYIPLNKIKPGYSDKITKRIKELRKTAQDCMHLLVVRKSKKDGGYIVVSGHQHLDYLQKHTKKTAAPCLVDESKLSTKFGSLLDQLRKRKLPYEVPHMKPNRLTPSTWAIMYTFLKQEPRFRRLSRSQQIKVILLGLQYKKTTIASMKAKVTDLLKVWV